jgi:hypothetical protein
VQHVRVYEEEWFVRPCFCCGVAMFFSGMWINLQSDAILRSSPQPSTLNPQPSSLNPQPSTLNPHPATRNPQPIFLHARAHVPPAPARPCPALHPASPILFCQPRVV